MYRAMSRTTVMGVTLLAAIVRRRWSMMVHPSYRKRVKRSGLSVWWPVLVGEEGEKVLYLYYAPDGKDGRWSLELCTEERDWEDDGEMGFTLGQWRRALGAYREKRSGS